MIQCPIDVSLEVCEAIYDAVEAMFWPGMALGFGLGVFFAVLCLLGYGIWRDSREIQWEDYR